MPLTKAIWTGLILGLYSVFSGNLFASTIDIVEPNKVQWLNSDANEGEVSVLRLAAPNSSGISINRFAELDIDQPIKWLSAERSVGEDAPRLVVVVADNMRFSSHIDVLGITSDILLISTHSSGRIECDNCLFTRLKRLVLAVAQPSDISGYTSTNFDDEISEIGLLKTTAAGTIVINNMSAPGVLSIETLSNDLSLSGKLISHESSSLDDTGLMQPDENGTLLTGVGQVNINLGPFIWNHDSSTRVSIYDAGTRFYSLGGEIVASAVKVSVVGDLRLNTTTTTQADAISATQYNGQLVIPSESITVQTFANGNLTVYGAQNSAGKISFMATGSLDFPSIYTRVDGAIVNAFAAGDITNKAVIYGDTLAFACHSDVINQGDIYGRKQLEIAPQGNIFNQYGGVIQGDIVGLQSVGGQGIIRNGSRTPYMSTAVEASGALLDYNYEIIDLQDPDFALNFFDPSNMGTFYSLASDVATSQGSLTMASDNSASILAKHLTLSAKGVENINPYYTKSFFEGNPVFTKKNAYQVLMSAEESLKISATDYVVNSSALMILQTDALNSTLENPAFYIDSPSFTNERYRTVSTLVNLSNSTVNVDGDTTEYMYGMQTVSLAASPPGHVVAFSNFGFKGEQAFINNAGYFEAFENANIDTPIIHDIGYTQDGTGGTKTVTVVDSDDVCGNIDDSFVRGQCNLNTLNLTSVTNIVQAQELDSLFHVVGELQGGTLYQNNEEYNPNNTGATLYVGTHNVFNSYVKQIADPLLEQALVNATNYTIEDRVENPYGAGDLTRYEYTKIDGTEMAGLLNDNGSIGTTTEVIEQIRAQDKLTIKWGAEFQLDITSGTWDGTSVDWGDGVPDSSYTTLATPVTTYDGIKNRLYALIEDLSQSVTDFFAELNWWGDE